MLSWRRVHSKQDILGPDFIAHTYEFQRGSNDRVTTLVEHQANQEQSKAILYMHGYTDYFYQISLAQHFVQQGLRFFALDLQGYGRSIRPNNRPNQCESMTQYHDDMYIALAEIKAKGVKEVVILAHSTGGLIASGYLARYQAKTLPHQGEHIQVSGLILNSPFLELPFPPKLLRLLEWPIRIIVSLLPFYTSKDRSINVYARTLHKTLMGEWEYRLDWKPAAGFPFSLAWLKQIIIAQWALRKQRIDLPTLVCHSARSTVNVKDPEVLRRGDGVLDVDSMQAAARHTFSQLRLAKIEGGFHDIYLSPAPVRQTYLNAIDDWLRQQHYVD